MNAVETEHLLVCVCSFRYPEYKGGCPAPLHFGGGGGGGY